MSRTNISFIKFQERLINKYNYFIKTLYANSDEECLYIELKSPKFRKVFFIHIPLNYCMKVKDQPNIKYITPFQSENTTSYITSFNPKICDIVNISSDKFSFYDKDFIENGEVIFYTFGKEEKIEDEKTKKHKLIKNIEKDFNQLKEKLVDKEEFIHVKNENKELDKPIFKDKSGKIIEEGSELEKLIIESAPTLKINFDKNKSIVIPNSNSNSNSKELEHEIEEVIGEKDESLEELEDEEDEYEDLNNDIPSTISSEPVEIGLFYVCIDFSEFFEKIQEFEDSLINYYIELDEKEKIFRKKFTEDLKNAIESSKEKLDKKINEMEHKEEDLRLQIQKLTKILNQCEMLEKKKLGDEEIHQLIKKTRNTIDELNMECLKLRDDMNKILLKCDIVKNFINNIF